jgi:hypothetical protein
MILFSCQEEPCTSCLRINLQNLHRHVSDVCGRARGIFRQQDGSYADSTGRVVTRFGFHNLRKAVSPGPGPEKLERFPFPATKRYPRFGKDEPRSFRRIFQRFAEPVHGFVQAEIEIHKSVGRPEPLDQLLSSDRRRSSNTFKTWKDFS